MEKIIHSRIYNYLEDHNYFTPAQGGFRPGMGTTETIATMLSYIYENFNNNFITAAIYFDLSKAFDSINHEILLIKLEAAGISGNCLKLMKNYLSNRQQICKINNNLSKPQIINYGVPQGSNLGPLLFIIFINDITNFVTNVKISPYADDTAFYLSGPNKNVISNELTSAASKFSHWCKLNKLTLNPNKTKSIIYTPSRNKAYNHIPIINLDNMAIDRVEEFKYLGVILDKQLNFENHIRMVKLKSLCRMQTLRKVRWSLTEKDALTLYKSSILPYMDIGDLFYSSANLENLNGLQVVQNKALRIIISKKNWQSTETAHTRCRLLKLRIRRNKSLSYYPQNILKNEGQKL